MIMVVMELTSHIYIKYMQLVPGLQNDDAVIPKQTTASLCCLKQDFPGMQ
jgi:hypothetical protein